MTQDAVDAVKDCGLTDIWFAGGWDYHDLAVHHPGLYNKSHKMPVQIDMNKNISFHLTWELEEFKAYGNSWKMPHILDYIENNR